MRIVNRRRDLEAAHSAVIQFKPITTAEARKQVTAEGTKIGQDLVHMLQHIGDLEQKMIAELNPMITAEEEAVCPVIKGIGGRANA